MSNFLSVNLVQKIGNADLEKMLKILKPVAADGVKEDGVTKKMRLVNIKGVHRRETAYLWSPKFGREVHIAYGNGAIAMCPTFHNGSVFFKPSLAEVYASIRAFVPEWHKAKYVWLNTDLTSRGPMIWNNIETVHMARAHLFDTDFLRVDPTIVDEVADLDEEN